MTKRSKDIIVLFGATGDLARRYLLPAISELQKKRNLTIILVGRRDWNDDDKIQYIRSVSEELDATDMHYVRVDLQIESDYLSLKEKLDSLCEYDDQVLYYLSLGSNFFLPVVYGLARHDLHTIGRSNKPGIMIEKPFGRDLKSATLLNIEIHNYFQEDQIFRVDHYLGKNLVSDLHNFRMKQGSDWYADRVKQITVTANETLTVLSRGELYDKSGAVRDYLQNHLLQILAIAAMREPYSSKPDDIRDKKMQFLQSITPFLVDPRHDIVFGQYMGYQEEEGVDPNSKTETFIFAKLHSDDPLWHDTCFTLQTGKGLHEKRTEVEIEFHDGKKVSFRETDQNRNNAYERLLADALDGDQTLFVRWDSIKAAWIIVDEMLSCTDNCFVVYSYQIGSKGPDLLHK